MACDHGSGVAVARQSRQRPDAVVASLYPRDAWDAGPGQASFAMSTQASSPSSAAWSSPVSAVASAGAASEDSAATNVRSASSP
jgi:hypothetical protein